MTAEAAVGSLGNACLQLGNTPVSIFALPQRLGRRRAIYLPLPTFSFAWVLPFPDNATTGIISVFSPSKSQHTYSMVTLCIWLFGKVSVQPFATNCSSVEVLELTAQFTCPQYSGFPAKVMRKSKFSSTWFNSIKGRHVNENLDFIPEYTWVLCQLRTVARQGRLHIFTDIFAHNICAFSPSFGSERGWEAFQEWVVPGSVPVLGVVRIGVWAGVKLSKVIWTILAFFWPKRTMYIQNEANIVDSRGFRHDPS